MRPVFRIVSMLLVLAAVPIVGCGGTKQGGGPPSTTPSAYRFGLETDVDPIIGDPPGWFASAADRGLTYVSIELFTLDAVTYFDTPSLTGAGFSIDPEVGDIFGDLLKAAASHDIEVVVMIEAIAHVIGNQKPYDPAIQPDKLTIEMVQQLIGELAAAAEQAGAKLGVSEEAFEEPYVDAIDAATDKYGVEYVRFFDDLKCRPDVHVSEDYAYYPRDAAGDGMDQSYLASLLELQSNYGQLGHLDIMFGVAAGCGAQSGVGAAGGYGFGHKSHQNVALMRAVQYRPSFYMFIVGENDQGPTFVDEPAYVDGYQFDDTLVPLLDEFARRPADEAKPAANLVLETPAASASDDEKDFFELTRMSASVVTAAILAAGYDLVVTNKPRPDAALYYVLTPGLLMGSGGDISAESAALVDGSAPVFYQVAGAVAPEPGFDEVMAAAGIPTPVEAVGNEDQSSTFDPTPELVTAELPGGSVELRYRGYSMEVWDPSQVGTFSLGHYVHYIDPASVSGEVVVHGMMARDTDQLYDDDTALVVRQGQVYFVNSGYVHHAMTPVLANLMRATPVFRTPSYGYLTTGPSRSVFFAPYDTTIDVDLGGGSRVTQFDADGARLTAPTVSLAGTALTGSVGRFELVIVD